MREERLQIFDAIVAKCPQFERKGKSMIYTSANGHMFGLLNKAGEIGFRYAKDVQEKYIKEFSSDYYKSYGSVMKGYVLIPENMLHDIDNLAQLLNESYEYVMSLDPK